MVQPSSDAKVLNTDPGACYVCGGVASDWVEYRSSQGKHTRIHMCLEHFCLVREVLWNWLTAGRRKKA